MLITDATDLPMELEQATVDAAEVVSRIAAMDAAMDAALTLDMSTDTSTSGPTPMDVSGISVSDAYTFQSYSEPLKHYASWSISGMLNIRGALKRLNDDLVPIEVLLVDGTLQSFQVALYKVDSIGHRNHELESVLLRYKAPYFEPSVWAREYGSYGQALLHHGFHAAAVEWLQSQCEQLHPIYELTDTERRDSLLSFIRDEMRMLRNPGA